YGRVVLHFTRVHAAAATHIDTLSLHDPLPIFGYNLAFFSTEYPGYYQTGYNDMYVAWLQSEVWTGNISFDEMGNPISLNAGFLRSEEHTSELQSRENLVCRLLLEKRKIPPRRC